MINVHREEFFDSELEHYVLKFPIMRNMSVCGFYNQEHPEEVEVYPHQDIHLEQSSLPLLCCLYDLILWTLKDSRTPRTKNPHLNPNNAIHLASLKRTPIFQ